LLAGGGIAVGQCIYWLMTGVWSSLPLDVALGGLLRSMGAGWVGLQIIFSWILKLPLSLVLVLAGLFLFWALGAIAAESYRKRIGKTTPDQTRA
jgi:hypothetical protein